VNRLLDAPKAIRGLLRRWRHRKRYASQRAALAFASQPLRRIIIGSSGTGYDGWVSTERDVIDLLRERSWSSHLAPGCLDAILAEHVWEHLSADEADRAARICLRFLKPGGYLRVAVPDGYHPDAAYIEQVRPGGSGSGADDHKVLYTHQSFRDLFVGAGFRVQLYEYFDRDGRFQYFDWNPSDGMISRSKRFDGRNTQTQLAYTSIILDAIKPNC
jgi:predicted SAM-dependent methyltransferase